MDELTVMTIIFGFMLGLFAIALFMTIVDQHKANDKIETLTNQLHNVALEHNFIELEDIYKRLDILIDDISYLRKTQHIMLNHIEYIEKRISKPAPTPDKSWDYGPVMCNSKEYQEYEKAQERLWAKEVFYE